MNELQIVKTLLRALPIIQSIDTLTGEKLLLAFEVYERFGDFSHALDGELTADALAAAERLDAAVSVYLE